MDLKLNWSQIKHKWIKLLAVTCLCSVIIYWNLQPTVKKHQKFEFLQFGLKSHGAMSRTYEKIEPICKEPIDRNKSLVIMVSSSPDNFEKRRAIRESWASISEVHNNVTTAIFFLLGQTSNENVQNDVRAEAQKYSDIIQGPFKDHYLNLTLKSLYGMRYVIENCCHKFLMKTDDDVWINTPMLVKFINEKNVAEDLTLVGHAFKNAKPYRDKSNKYYMSYTDYPHETYPDFLSGTAYLMSRTVFLALYKCTTTLTRLIQLEDVLITGICAQKASVPVVNHPKFRFRKVLPCGKEIRGALTAHGYSADELKQIWLSLYSQEAQLVTPSC